MECGKSGKSGKSDKKQMITSENLIPINLRGYGVFFVKVLFLSKRRTRLIFARAKNEL